MSAAPKHARRSPAQVTASKRFAAAGRASQAAARSAAIAKTGKPPPRSKKQQAASRAWASAGRAAQKARRSGKQPVKPKAAAARYPQPGLELPPAGPGESRFSLHLLPACGPVALAEHLAMFTGIHLPDESVLALHNQAGVVSLAELLERAAAEGLAGPGTKLAWFERCDPDTAVPGLICGIELPGIGYHAVLLREAGMLSWGRVLPLAGRPDEAWWLEWEAE
jgi:hypothetical protein